jgi:hypothetical protein
MVSYHVLFLVLQDLMIIVGILKLKSKNSVNKLNTSLKLSSLVL